MGRLWGFIGISLVIVVVLLGIGVLIHLTQEHKPEEHTLMTDADVALYRRAARLLSRMVSATNLADLSGDILSPGTLKDVEAWLNDYKEELNKDRGK